MKKIIYSAFVLTMAFFLQACSGANQQSKPVKYDFQGGLSIDLPQDQFGTVAKVDVNPQDFLAHYQESDPKITEIQTAMYDNFNNYAPIGFSYAYTQVNTNFFENEQPFGVEDALYDSIENITINGKACRKSVFSDLDLNKKITILSCKDNNQSWDIFMQAFYVVPDAPADLTQQEIKGVDNATKEINQVSETAIDKAIATIQIK